MMMVVICFLKVGVCIMSMCRVLIEVKFEEGFDVGNVMKWRFWLVVVVENGEYYCF